MEGKCLLSALIRVEGARWERKVCEHRIKCAGSAVEGCGVGSPPCQPRAAGQVQCSLLSTSGCSAGHIALICTVPSSPAGRAQRATLQSQTVAHNILSSQTCRNSPAHSMHLPRADRAGKSLLTGLRCGYHS